MIPFRNKHSRVLITILLLCVAFSTGVKAVVPPPDGGYPGFNTAEGQNALLNLTTGVANTGVGWFSLSSVNTGSLNTATGAGALLFNTVDENTAFGAAALFFNTIGFENTSVGSTALLNNTEGNLNTAVGAAALVNNIDGNSNSATGAQALQDNTTGNGDTAIGRSALMNNTIGNTNTAIGINALQGNTSGNNNIALGGGAGAFLTSGDDNIDIGNFGVADESGTIRIGSEFQARTFIAGIRGVTTDVDDAVNVVIDSNGQLGTLSSSRRFKKQISSMDNASEAVLALKPVRFHYRSDKTNRPQFGLIAEEVAEVNPDLVVRDKSGEIYTVRYDAVNAMLLNEFLKEHQKVQALQANDAERRTEIKALMAMVKEQAAQIQKMSADIEISKATPSILLNNR